MDFQKLEIEQKKVDEYLGKIAKKIENLDHEQTFTIIKNVIIKHLQLFTNSSNNQKTDMDLIVELKKLSLKKELILKIEKIIEILIKYDYSNQKISESEMLFIVEEFRVVSYDLLLAYEEHEFEKKNKKLTKAKDFEKILNKVKKNELFELVPKNIIIKGMETYHYLEHENKEKYKSEYSFYFHQNQDIAKVLKDTIQLNNSNNETILHENIAILIKLMLKINQERQEILRTKIFNLIPNDEVKLNIHIMFCHEYIHSKNIQLSLKEFHELKKYYANLTPNKKKFYYNILSRLSQRIVRETHKSQLKSTK